MLVVSSLISSGSNLIKCLMFQALNFTFQFGKEGNFENFEVRWNNFEGANKLGPQKLMLIMSLFLEGCAPFYRILVCSCLKFLITWAFKMQEKPSKFELMVQGKYCSNADAVLELNKYFLTQVT